MKALRTKRVKDYLSPWLFILPAVVLYSFTKYYPILQSIFVSFFKFSVIKPPGEFIGLKNYLDLFKDQYFYQDLGNMIWYFIIIMLINFWPPIIVAILVNEVRKHKTVFRAFYFIPAIAPTIAVQLIWKYIWNPDYGMANQLLKLFGLPGDQMWLNSPELVKWCLYIPYFIMCGGMNFVIYLAALQDVPNELYEACVIDGGGILARIRYVTLPGIKHVIEIMLVLQIINVVNLINEPLIMTGGGPAGASETLSLYAYRTAIKDLNYGKSFAISTIVFILSFVLTSIQMKISSNRYKEV